MNKHITTVFVIVSLLVSSCNSCSNKAGQKVGETLGEFTEGVGKGAETAFDIVVEPSAQLKEKGLGIGKVLLSSDTATANQGHDNKLSVYMTFDTDFESEVVIKITDAKGLEMGRSKLAVKAKKGDAGYYDFIFDKRTNIDSDSKITIE